MGEGKSVFAYFFLMQEREEKRGLVERKKEGGESWTPVLDSRKKRISLYSQKRTQKNVGEAQSPSG